MWFLTSNVPAMPIAMMAMLGHQIMAKSKKPKESLAGRRGVFRPEACGDLWHTLIGNAGRDGNACAGDPGDLGWCLHEHGQRSLDNMNGSSTEIVGFKARPPCALDQASAGEGASLRRSQSAGGRTVARHACELVTIKPPASEGV